MLEGWISADQEAAAEVDGLRGSWTRANNALMIFSILMASRRNHAGQSFSIRRESTESSVKSMGDASEGVEPRPDEGVHCAGAHDVAHSLLNPLGEFLAMPARIPQHMPWRPMEECYIRRIHIPDSESIMGKRGGQQYSVRNGHFTHFDWYQPSSRPPRSKLFRLGLLPLTVVTASAAPLFYSWPCSSHFSLYPELLPLDPGKDPQTTALLDQMKSVMGSVPALVFAIFLYCLLAGLFYFLHIRSRSQELIFSGALVITTAMGYMGGLTTPEIVFSLLPWTCLLALCFAAWSGRPTVHQ
ncbi:hypothetical protein PG996_010355 [Apiospora saccharicola]|uniref:Uncharacterized protein n=1 Tax=Apiospora saccharicola TaxID=335842 RepID=A0ABR1UQT4_9PEZI